MSQSSDIDTSGFPVGYFVVKSVATGKVFDVSMDEIEDGTDIILFPEKEKSVVESKGHSITETYKLRLFRHIRV